VSGRDVGRDLQEARGSSQDSSPKGHIERSFGRVSRFRRLARAYERLPETMAGLHYVVFVILVLKNVADESWRGH